MMSDSKVLSYVKAQPQLIFRRQSMNLNAKTICHLEVKGLIDLAQNRIIQIQPKRLSSTLRPKQFCIWT